jgi:hypothetical protein
LSDLLRLIILAPLAWVAAVIVAAAVIAAGVFGPPLDPATTGFYAGTVISLSVYAGTFSFLPAMIAIAVAEIFRLRSILFYVVVGGGLGLTAHQLSGFAAAFEPQNQMLVILLAGGFAGGLTYWLIAGRLAGVSVDSAPRS